MNAKRVLCASSLAAGIGLTGLFGTGIALANAAPLPGNAPIAASKGAPAPQPGPSIKLDHHDRKKAVKQEKKELKHHPADVVATSGHR
ncbi:hypothetical protein [Mycobacterium talmoniae]|uniref:Uncharacterized protein n=1 Tax=Mycobacterium talmoniae TaxID=1858794 RepID=A0A1S1MUA6_9MYCO|nr:MULTISPECIES: hypothetical protein [Mycobacterium]OHU92345.1 hypothetical protein BKN37_25125 [Mycobacterium talmoniae]PQM49358.1 hypothetical protein C1Y40_00437 [Mycobacterium talmoniae]TDH49174.1 hypothetical protein E2F47_21255 [Mycobacterium eburneum]